MKYGEWTLGQVEALLNKLGGSEVAFGVLRGTVEVTTTVVTSITHTFTVLVDETQTVEEAVKDCKFDWSNKNIVSANFPKPESGAKLEKEIILFHFAKSMSSDAVIAEMDKAGYRPVKIWDLLGLAKKELGLQREFPIVALGSVWRDSNGSRNVAYLGRSDTERSLDLSYFYDDWLGFYRFAALRK